MPNGKSITDAFKAADSDSYPDEFSDDDKIEVKGVKPLKKEVSSLGMTKKHSVMPGKKESSISPRRDVNGSSYTEH
jgi:hypothetical protein